jgi:pyruvate dehydrogenase E2 component (dihydrolipoamide acetyltransferase)
MDVVMPQLGETVTEGTITRWFKQLGDRVEADEPLFEVSTDKVDSEVPAPGAGYLAEIRVPEGETVEVGAVLAVLSDSPDGAAPAPAPAPAATPEAAEAPEAAPAAPPAPAPEPEAASAAPPPPPPVEALGPAPEAAPPASEPAEPPVEAPAPPPPPPRVDAVTAAASAPPPLPEGVVVSPLVRRLLAEHDLDAADVVATGEGGRITRNDVILAARAQREAPPPPPPPPAPPAPPPAAAPAPQPSAPAEAASASAPPAPDGGTRDSVVPFDNIRRLTAEHMVRSKATSAHVYTSIEVDFEGVERTRRRFQDEWREREGLALTYLPFIARAVCDAIDDFPRVNASIEGETLVVHRDVNLGIAVDLGYKGLVAPVVRGADGKRLRLIAREIKDLAGRAHSKRLSPDEIVGGTFTITNMGPFGTLMTLPIINQPQVAILATDAVRKRPVVVEGPDGEDTIAIHHTGLLTLTWDHRAFDGAYAASFLRLVRDGLEQRDWDAELA